MGFFIIGHNPVECARARKKTSVMLVELKQDRKFRYNVSVLVAVLNGETVCKYGAYRKCMT